MACGKQWTRGSQLYRCRDCDRVTCTGCREKVPGQCPAAMRRPVVPARDPGQLSIWQAMGTQDPAEQELNMEKGGPRSYSEPPTSQHPPRLSMYQRRHDKESWTSCCRPSRRQSPAQSRASRPRSSLMLIVGYGSCHPYYWQHQQIQQEASTTTMNLKLTQASRGRLLAVLRSRLMQAQEGEWEP